MFASRHNNLDFVRLFLAILVIYSHCYPLGLGNEEIEPMMLLSRGQTTFGTIAVDIFFIISGFLITNSFLKAGSYTDYFRKRIGRIYPGFIVCMLFSLIVVVPIAHVSWSSPSLIKRALNFVGETLILQHFSFSNAFPANHSRIINGSVWSISYEFYCYIGLALFGFLGLLKRRRAVLILFVLSLVGLIAVAFLAHLPSQAASHSGRLIGLAHILQRVELRFPLIPMYLAGMVFFLYRDVIPHKTSLALASLALLCACLFIPHAWFLGFAVGGTYLTFWFAFHPKVKLHHFASRGDFSYGTYLYAFPVQQIVLLWLGPTMNPYALLVIAAPISLLLAIASWNGVEKWFLSSRRRHGTDAAILAQTTERLPST